jgi:hypothetical protein
MPTSNPSNPLTSHELDRTETATFIHFVCRRCLREFRYSPNGVAAWAVDESGAALEDRVSQRWLNEPCPEKVLKRDDYDRTRRK